MNAIKNLSELILKKFYDHTGDNVFTVAITGIDASGKGYVSKLLEDELKTKGLEIANINIDPWQHPIPVRLQRQDAAKKFYENVFRWDDFFKQLVIPLRKNRGIQLTSRLIHTHADEYYDFKFDYKETDILLLEGIFLFQEKFLQYYDFKIWINCSFETALKRALKRNVEKLDEQQLLSDYNAYYYPAQRYHFMKDKPIQKADYLFDNN